MAYTLSNPIFAPMANEQNNFAELISHCKEYGYIFQSSEIYDGLAAVYDYGQNGAQLKKNIRDYWWKSMTQLHDNIVGIDAAIFMHPTTWKASGHVDNFSDPMIDNKDSKKRYRVDHLIESYIEQVLLFQAHEIKRKIIENDFTINKFTTKTINNCKIINNFNYKFTNVSMDYAIFQYMVPDVQTYHLLCEARTSGPSIYFGFTSKNEIQAIEFTETGNFVPSLRLKSSSRSVK